MPGANVFNLGKDITLVINTPQGILSLPVTTTTFEARPQYNKIRKIGIDGVNRGANVPTGWEGTIELDRNNSQVDLFFNAAEAGYYAGQNSYTATIAETVYELNGSTTNMQYTGVVLSFEEAGKFQGDKEVNQSIGFFASRRITV